MPDEKPVLAIREAIPGDMPYVLSTWVRSYGNTIPSGRRRDAIIKYRKIYVDRIMRDKPKILVLSSPDSPNTLHGYAVLHRGTLAWVYVTKGLRQMGLARDVIRSALGSYPESVDVYCEWPFETTRFRPTSWSNIAA